MSQERIELSRQIEPMKWPPGIQCVYDAKIKEWDVGFIAESTAQQRASILEQLEAKGWNP